MTPSIRCTLTLACAAVVAAGDTPPAPRPHVLIILADDLGYGDVGFHGCKDIPTPNLDRLAASGVRCTDAYVSAPQCSPSRAGLLTGRLQQRFGYECNADDTPELGLPANQPTIAERLSAAGYATGGFGKWHLGSAPALRPTARGFGTWWGFWGGGRNFTPGSGVGS
jgi:arylsulfatase A-like enzyme